MLFFLLRFVTIEEASFCDLNFKFCYQFNIATLSILHPHFMSRVYNFSAGPAAIPEAVLQKAQAELLDYGHSGMSIMEMSHRGNAFTQVLDEATELLRELMQVSEDYDILFIPGGASAQFALIPMNFVVNKQADYVDTGVWSTKAINEAGRILDVNTIASSKDADYNYIPTLDTATFNPNADYFHITTNNTIYGTCYDTLPNTGKVPLIGDMSSDILSKEYDVSRFGMIYAGAQKNIGPAGLAICIIRKDLLDRCSSSLPNVFNYRTIAENESMYNTPPTFGIYMCKLVLEWLKAQGGVAAMEQVNLEKAACLYDFLDNASLFKSTVQPPFRSIMNVPFVTGSEALDAQFLKEAEQAGLTQLKGHRTTGGMRASIYNAMPLAGVQALVAFLKRFEMANK